MFKDNEIFQICNDAEDDSGNSDGDNDDGIWECVAIVFNLS